MFFIIDKNDMIQDIASEQVNLSRGFGFEDHKIYQTENMLGATIGDTFKDGLFFIDINRKAAEEVMRTREALISNEVRAIAIAKLKSEGKIPADYTED